MEVRLGHPEGRTEKVTGLRRGTDLVVPKLALSVRRFAHSGPEYMGHGLSTLTDTEDRKIRAHTGFDPAVLVNEEWMDVGLVDGIRTSEDDRANSPVGRPGEVVAGKRTPQVDLEAVEREPRGDAVVGRIFAVPDENHPTISSLVSLGHPTQTIRMCGIAGVWTATPSTPLDTTQATASVSRLLAAMPHRGPDAEGMCVVPGAGVVGHCRLSIMDPTGGDQPIYNADRTRAIAANGEIYNFPALRTDLSTDHVFTTGSDSEAVLHLYQRHGADLVRYLEGMYAFAIVDGPRLVLARDPLGIKPLYWAMQDDQLWFASEIKALAPFCDNVKEFPPGTIHVSDVGTHTFYEVPVMTPIERPVDDYVREVRDTLTASVVSHCMSDVGLGAFLSGGLDSSIIAALAKAHLGELHTFSVGVEGSSDLAAARLVADHLGTIHHEYIITADEVLACLPEIVHSLESFDQDLVRSAVPCFFTSRLAAQFTKVILTGEGADELFAGYTYHRSIRDPEALHRELRRTITTLHDINLQRADRLTMLHSIEGRVPFLDLRMVELAQRIPVSLKLHGEPAVEKWVLRKAFEDVLPESIVWRKKLQFDEGSGTADLLPQVLSALMTEEEADEYRLLYPDTLLRSAEECHYHRLLVSSYERPEPVLANVARWAGDRI